MSQTPERIRRNEEILAKVMDGEAILVNASTGTYYSIDKAGAVAWELLELGHALDAVAGALSEQYEVTREEARRDLERLVHELLEAELVRDATAEEAASGEPEPHAGDRLPYVAPSLVSYSDLGDLLALDPPAPTLGDVSWDE